MRNLAEGLMLLNATYKENMKTMVVMDEKLMYHAAG